MEEEEEKEEEEFEKNLKIPELIFTIDINNISSIIVSTVWVLGGGWIPRLLHAILEPALIRVKCNDFQTRAISLTNLTHFIQETHTYLSMDKGKSG